VPNEVPLWQMSVELKKDVTVVLSGEGADELFCGYGRIFRSADDYERMRAGVSGQEAERLRKEYGRLDFASPEDFFLSRYRYFGEDWAARLLGADLHRDLQREDYPRKVFSEAFAQCADLPVARQFPWIFQRLHLPGLLQRLDKTTMAASVEGRVPFVDHRVVELGPRLPLGYRMPWVSEEARARARGLVANEISEVYDTPKWVLREAFRSRLPARVVDRRKVGFPVPLGSWLDGRFRARARDLLLDETSRSRGIVDPSELGKLLAADEPFTHAAGMRVWMLYNLEIFVRSYFDATLPSP
jgi:asparagine synthase (glutamine-hydrolysing)